MTRRFLAPALAAALVSCGSSDDGAALLEGFSPADQGALVVPVTDCTATFGYDVTGLLFGFTSFTNACGFAQATNLCGNVASSTSVTISILRGRNSPPDPAAIGTGTYTISLTGNPSVEPDGSLIVALAEVTQTSASCGEPAAYPNVTAGSVTISSVSASTVTGSVDVSFSDGSRFQRSFTLPVCAFTPYVCSLLDDSCTMPACCPTSTSCPAMM